jgi:hypothetical protein
MARIIYGSIATEINGSVGGSTFQRNAYGFTMKNKPNMARLQSIKQNEQHRRLDYVVKGWQQITEVQRSSWNSWALSHPIPAKHNAMAVLTGYTYFLKYNLLHTMFATNYLAEPSAGVLALPSINPYLVYSAGVFSVNSQPDVDILAIFYNLYLSPPMSKTRGFSDSFTRAISIFDLVAGNHDITSAYQAVFGIVPTSGVNIFAEFQLWGGSIPYIFASQKFILNVL